MKAIELVGDIDEQHRLLAASTGGTFRPVLSA
jgi:hypothetical protein